MKHVVPLLLLLACVWPFGARAAASCTIVPAPGGTLVDFGNYDAMSGDRDAIGQIQFLCVPDLLTGPTVSYALAINSGTGGGSFNPRRMMAGAYGLNYNLFLDPSRTQIFGDGSAGTGKAAGACAGSCAVAVYGRIYSAQPVPAAQYRDELLATLDF